MHIPKIALLEIGGSHSECLLSQMIALKNANCYVVLCSPRNLLEEKKYFSQYINEFCEITLTKSKVSRFLEVWRFNRWMKKQNIDVLIFNTAHGSFVRNLCFIAPKKIVFLGILHSIKNLQGSFTQNIISRKIKHYFVLNNTLKKNVRPQKNVRLEVFYPIDFPHFSLTMSKPSDQYWVCMIGGVEYIRKDLDGFLTMVEQTPENVHFFFLGKTHTHIDNVARFQETVERSKFAHRIHLFTRFLNNSEMDNYLQLSDAIFPLIHPHTLCAEEHLKNQITGSINVAFGYKIPMMIHEHYRDWEDFHHGVVFYRLENFAEQFRFFQAEKDRLIEEMKQNQNFDQRWQNQQFARSVLAYCRQNEDEPVYR